MHVDKVRSPAYFHPNHHCTTNKWLELEVPSFFANLCRLMRYLCMQTFIQIVNVLDLNFKGQRFKSNISMASSKVIILQTVSNRTNIALANTYKSYVAFRLAYFHLTLAHSKGQD